MRDHDAFDDPASPKQSVLIECGQHWDASSPVVALDAIARFLVVTGLLARDQLPVGWFAPRAHPCAPAYEVTHAIVPKTAHFRFAQPFTGLEVLDQGDVLGWDDDVPVTIPYDRCALIMPSVRHAQPGVTVVRLARMHAAAQSP
jgi:hypothetical protein